MSQAGWWPLAERLGSAQQGRAHLLLWEFITVHQFYFRQTLSLSLRQDHIKGRGLIYKAFENSKTQGECGTCIFLQSLLHNFALREVDQFLNSKDVTSLNFNAEKWDPESIRGALWKRKWVRPLFWCIHGLLTSWEAFDDNLLKLYCVFELTKPQQTVGIWSFSPKCDSGCPGSSNCCWNAVIMTSAHVV